ncbi:MAG: hypothetical protein WAT79_02355 [Saprospiraceae bacterium]
MKRNLILLTTLILLSTGAYFLYEKSRVNNKMSSLSEERNFTVESPEMIHKIILKRKDEKPLTFKKLEKNIWSLNDTYRADEIVIGYMVQVLTRAKMLSIPSKNALKNIRNSMDQRGIDVEVYDQNDVLLKKLTIGADLQNGAGTYMLLDGFNQPYAVELPSLGGVLRSRFEQPFDKYRDRYIYREPLETIQSVKVEYHTDPAASYLIEKVGDKYDISPVSALVTKNSQAANQSKIKTYLGFYEEMGTELMYNDYEKKDSVLTLQPFCTITLTSTDQSVKKYDYWSYDAIVYNDPEKTRSVEAAHIGRYFVYTGDFYTVQTVVFGKLFSAYPYFF